MQFNWFISSLRKRICRSDQILQRQRDTPTRAAAATFDSCSVVVGSNSCGGSPRRRAWLDSVPDAFSASVSLQPLCLGGCHRQRRSPLNNVQNKSINPSSNDRRSREGVSRIIFQSQSALDVTQPRSNLSDNPTMYPSTSGHIKRKQNYNIRHRDL